MKKIIGLFLLLILYGCGAKSNYSTSNINKSFYEDKVVYFRFDSKGKTELEKAGMSQGIGIPQGPPEIKKQFKNSIEELATELKIDLNYLDSEYITIPNDSDKNIIIIDVKLTKLLWKFGFSKAVMYSDAIYTLSNERTYDISGSHKVIGGGNPSNNVKKALKNLSYNFLVEFER